MELLTWSTRERPSTLKLRTPHKLLADVGLLQSKKTVVNSESKARRPLSAAQIRPAMRLRTTCFA